MNETSPRQRRPGRILSALLQTDLPVAPRSDAEIADEVEHNYRWNLTVNLLEGTAFWFGLSFISASTIVPLFISKLTSSPLPIGLAAVIAQGAWFLPQLFTANAVEGLPRKKPVVVRLGLFLERLPVWLLVVAALLAVRAPALALIIFFVGYAWRGLGGGVVATAWQDLVARCFPVERRGRFFGMASFLGAAMGVAGASLSSWILQVSDFPASFVYLFTLAAVALLASWFFLSLTREPVQPVRTPRQSNRDYLSGLSEILHHDHNFRRFLGARSLLALGSLGAGFVTVAAIQRWQVPDSSVGLYTAAYWGGQMMGYLAFGFLADRFGHKLPLELGALSSVLAFVVAWLAPSPEWIYLVFVLLGISLSSVIVSGILVALEFCKPERRPTYAGLTNTTAGVVAMAAPLLGAWLAGISYGWLFALSAVINLAAWAAMRWGVREPRWSPVVEIE
jgi:MFS family permease